MDTLELRGKLDAVELKKRYAAEKAEKYAGEGREMGPGEVYMGDISSCEAIGDAH